MRAMRYARMAAASSTSEEMRMWRALMACLMTATSLQRHAIVVIVAATCRGAASMMRRAHAAWASVEARHLVHW